jgi:hypothetical protein
LLLSIVWIFSTNEQIGEKLKNFWSFNNFHLEHGQLQKRTIFSCSGGAKTVKNLREMVLESFTSTLQYHFLSQVKRHKSIIELFFIPPIGSWCEMKTINSDKKI